MNWSRITQTCELTLVCDVLVFYFKKKNTKMCHKNSIVLHVLRTNYGENSVRNTDSDTQYCAED